jgi:hypothetical protein
VRRLTLLRAHTWHSQSWPKPAPRPCQAPKAAARR